MNNINDIIKIIPNLSYKNLQELDKQIKVYLALKIPKEESNNHELLYSAICSELDKIICPQMCFNAFRKTSNFSILKQTYKHIDSFIVLYLSNHLDITKYIRQKVYILYTITIIDYLRRINYDITLYNVLINYTKFLSEMEKKYPNYLNSNMGHFLFCTPAEIQMYLKTH